MKIGQPISRIDGHLKVTGSAKYAAEWNQPGVVYAFQVRPTIAQGTISAIDSRAALRSAGVITILTHENAPRLDASLEQQVARIVVAMSETTLPLQDNQVSYSGQFIAVIVAESYEQARSAAVLVKVTYTTEKPAAVLQNEMFNSIKPA